MSQTTINLCKGLPNLPKDDDGPVFAEPWQAQAFAMAVQLCDEGYFQWPEWVQIFSHEVKLAQAAGDPDLGNTYYNHWLNALEKIVAAKNIVSSPDMLTRKEEWRKAYLRTPHGQPIEL